MRSFAVIKDYLRMQFPENVMSERGDWLSSDLAIPDFFLWGHLKHRMWSLAAHWQPRSIQELEDVIVKECARILYTSFILGSPLTESDGGLTPFRSHLSKFLSALGRVFHFFCPGKVTFQNVCPL